MVILIKMPNLKSSTLWIERFFPKKFNLKRVPFHKYLKGNSFLFSELKHSNKFHGFIYQGTLYVHPDSYIQVMSKKYRALISRTLSS